MTIKKCGKINVGGAHENDYTKNWLSRVELSIAGKRKEKKKMILWETMHDLKA